MKRLLTTLAAALLLTTASAVGFQATQATHTTDVARQGPCLNC